MGVLTPDNSSFLAVTHHCERAKMKPKHQLAPSNSDIYCLSASLKGGREYGGVGGIKDMVRPRWWAGGCRYQVSGENAHHRGRARERRGGRAESGIMRGKSIGGRKKNTPLREEGGEGGEMGGG